MQHQLWNDAQLNIAMVTISAGTLLSHNIVGLWVQFFETQTVKSLLLFWKPRSWF